MKFIRNHKYTHRWFCILSVASIRGKSSEVCSQAHFIQNTLAQFAFSALFASSVIYTVFYFTMVVQKVRSHIFCLFFRQHWFKPPRGECSGGLNDYTVNIWRLNVCFSSCFTLVKVELPVADVAKFEMCVVIRFLHAEGQPDIKILSNWSLKIQNEMPPPLWV